MLTKKWLLDGLLFVGALLNVIKNKLLVKDDFYGTNIRLIKSGGTGGSQTLCLYYPAKFLALDIRLSARIERAGLMSRPAFCRARATHTLQVLNKW